MSSYGLLYEHSFLKVNCTANGVIPVPRHWFLQSHRKRFSMLVCLLTSKLSWIPDWDDIFAVFNKNKCSYSCGMNRSIAIAYTNN
ncbi:MAG: hypothetical protein ACRC6C_03880 [Wolbachia pipientis]